MLKFSENSFAKIRESLNLEKIRQNSLILFTADRVETRAGIFIQSMGARNRGEYGYRTDPPGYIGGRNSILGIDSWAP